MKFAKYEILSSFKPYDSGLTTNRELDQELVPEWRAKYLNYKVCEPSLATDIPLTIDSTEKKSSKPSQKQFGMLERRPAQGACRAGLLLDFQLSSRISERPCTITSIAQSRLSSCPYGIAIRVLPTMSQ